MTKKRIATMATCIALVGAVAVGGTLALLTQQSNDVTNIFTVGKGYDADEIKLDEDTVTQEVSGANLGGYKGNKVEVENRVKTNTYANLVANTTLDKDPTFRIVNDEDETVSPKSWFVAKVEGVTDNAGKLSVSAVMPGNGWYEVSVVEGAYTYTPVASGAQIKDDTFYIYDTAISAGEATDPLFTQLHVDAVTAGTNPANIVISGTAVEAVGDATFEASRDAVMAAAGMTK